MPDAVSPSSHDAPRDISPGAILGSAVAILTAVALSALAAHVLLDVDGMRAASQNAQADLRIHGVRLESAPQLDKARYLAQKRRSLESWGWVDRQAGIAHIPIEEAMRQLEARQAGAAHR